MSKKEETYEDFMAREQKAALAREEANEAERVENSHTVLDVEIPDAFLGVKEKPKTAAKTSAPKVVKTTSKNPRPAKKTAAEAKVITTSADAKVQETVSE